MRIQIIREKWLCWPLKKKIIIIMVQILLVVIVSESITIFFGMFTLEDFESVINSNSIYHELQTVIKNEQETFILYVRNRTDENKLALEDACAKSERCIESLPFEYEKLGEERYARTWNVVNGYEGYKEYREQLLQKSDSDLDYIDVFYEVLAMQESLSNYALKLVQVTLGQWDEVYEEKMQLFKIVPLYQMLFVLVMLFLIAKTWQLLIGTLIKPIILIAEDSRKIAANQFDTPVLSVENKDEIGELVVAFNKMKEAMIGYIHTLEEKNKMEKCLHRKELEKAEIERNLEQARFDILKHQINPHFLFNTLNMISGMARLEEAEITSKMTVSLGNLFRYNLRTMAAEVFLEQEIEVLDDYIYIQQMRFDNRIQYEKQIELDIYSVRIPSFTLQPIVENAFVHGVSQMEDTGKISVRIWKEKNKVIICIKDNGCGMEENVLLEVRKKMQEKDISGHGIGLGNIYRRIRMMYGDEGKMEIFSTSQKGTKVQLEIPQREEGVSK